MNSIETWLSADDFIDNFVAKCKKSDADFDDRAWERKKNADAVWQHNSDKRSSFYKITKIEY